DPCDLADILRAAGGNPNKRKGRRPRAEHAAHVGIPEAAQPLIEFWRSIGRRTWLGKSWYAGELDEDEPDHVADAKAFLNDALRLIQSNVDQDGNLIERADLPNYGPTLDEHIARRRKSGKSPP